MWFRPLSIRMLKAIQQRRFSQDHAVSRQPQRLGFASCRAGLFVLDVLQIQGESSLFVDSLMSEMTLEEKISQLNLVNQGGAVTGSVISKDVEQKIRDGYQGGRHLRFPSASKMRKSRKLRSKQSRLGIPLLTAMDVIHGHTTKPFSPSPGNVLHLGSRTDPGNCRTAARDNCRRHHVELFPYGRYRAIPAGDGSRKAAGKTPFLALKSPPLW